MSFNSLLKRFANGSLWLFLGNTLAQILTFSASILIARLLGKTTFGEYGMITNTLGMLGVFAGLGLGLTTTKYVAELKLKDPEQAGIVVGSSIIISLFSGGIIGLALFIFSPFLAEQTLNAPHLTEEIRISSLYIFFNAVNGMQIGALSGLESFKASSKINIIRGVLFFGCTILGTYLGGLKGIIIANVVASGITTWLSHKAIKLECAYHNIKISYKLQKKQWGILWNFSFPALISNILTIPAMWIGNTLLVNQPNGYAEMGIISAANQWRMMLLFLPTIFNGVALPILSEQNESTNNNFNNFETMVDMLQSVSIITIIPMYIVIILSSDWIMQLYGSDFSNGSSILILMVTGFTISAVGNAAGVAIQSMGKMWLGAFMNFTWASIYLIFIGVFVKFWHGLALAIGFSLAHLVLIIWAYIYLKNNVGKIVFRRTIIVIIFIIIACALAIMMSTSVKLWLVIPFTTLSIFIALTKWSNPIIKNKLTSSLKSKFVP